MEIWKNVYLSSDYEVSNYGNFRMTKTKRKLKTIYIKGKKLSISIHNIYYDAGLIMCKTFKQPIKGMIIGVKYKDTSFLNLKLDNLEPIIFNYHDSINL